MSRMIGAEIRYTQMGYYMRQARYGYISKKIETQNGKRCILKPHPVESKYVIKMFDMRCQGFDDRQIIEKINEMGYHSRMTLRRDKTDRTKVISQVGGNLMESKALLRILENPIYAGIICEKWTDNKPIRSKFKGLVSFETFNQANRGKVAILEQDDKLTVYRKPPPEYLVKKGARNPDFPYKKVVMCPGCSNPLFGSASEGKMGKYYPAYHCHARGHYFRVPKQEFDETIERFVQNIQLAPNHLEEISAAVLVEWDRRQLDVKTDDAAMSTQIQALKLEAKLSIDKIKFLSSETAIKYMEEDLMKTEAQIANLTKKMDDAKGQKPVDLRVVLASVKYYLEHLDQLLLQQIDPVKKANFFGVFFDKAPTYEEIRFGTQKTAQLPGVNELFRLSFLPKNKLVTSWRIELQLPG